jgi:hypothetical protein
MKAKDWATNFGFMLHADRSLKDWTQSLVSNRPKGSRAKPLWTWTSGKLLWAQNIAAHQASYRMASRTIFSKAKFCTQMGDRTSRRSIRQAFSSKTPQKRPGRQKPFRLVEHLEQSFMNEPEIKIRHIRKDLLVAVCFH